MLILVKEHLTSQKNNSVSFQKLDENQIKVILSKPSSLNPLWLTILAEQLRTFGDFRTLDKHIDALSDTINGLIQYILKDLIANDDTGKMEKVRFCFVCRFFVHRDFFTEPVRVL